MPEPEVANLVQSFGQDVLQEAAHELGTLQCAGAPAIGLAVLGAKGNRALVEGDDARVGNGNAEDVMRALILFGHPFWRNPAICSDPIRPPILTGSGHPF